MDFNAPIYAFGYNEHTQALAKCCEIKGIIDEFSNEAEIEGIPRADIDQVEPGYTVVNCVYNSRAIQAQCRLETLFDRVVFIGDYVKNFLSSFKGTMLADAYLAMQNDYEQLCLWLDQFDDVTSSREFKSILDFRRTLDISHLAEFSVRIDEQYYEPFVVNNDYQCLLDGGAYDGSDSVRFAELFPNYSAIKIFEPSEKNRNLIVNNTADLSPCDIIPACLGDQQTTVYFSGEGTAAKMVAAGGVVTEMTTIDHQWLGDSTFVKLDIEGAEMQALAGAVQARTSARVGFAISAYHLPHDFKHILEWIRQSSVPRRLYFRHYSGGIAESVMFAL